MIGYLVGTFKKFAIICVVCATKPNATATCVSLDNSNFSLSGKWTSFILNFSVFSYGIERNVNHSLLRSQTK